MKSSDAVALYLARHSIDYCYEVAGGMITHLLDSFSKKKRMKITSMHHEQAAAFAAEGIARCTRGRELGLAMGTSGPGATNLITGIGSCWFDSIPCLFITGQVNKHELKGKRGVRQQGFQELDIIPLVSSITKYAVQVTDAKDLLPQLHKAVNIAIAGRNGPVLLDITFNAQREEIEDREALAWAAKKWEWPKPSAGRRPAWLSRLSLMCRRSRRPLVMIGGGAVWADSLDKWVDLMRVRGIPYVSTLMGAQWLAKSPCYFGMMGTYGKRTANWAVQNCDLLLVIGARMDVRQTGAMVEDFARRAEVVQVDIDPSQLNNRIKADLDINCSAEEFFRSVLAGDGLQWSISPEWMRLLKKTKTRLDVDEYHAPGITPHKLFRVLNKTFEGENVSYVADVGNHQMWAATLLDLHQGQSAHYCGGMGSMGFGLPASTGVAMRSGGKVINIAGDGSIQMNIQELDTIRRLDLDLTVLVLDNHCLGMVKSFQDAYFEGRNQSTVIGYGHPDFVKVARGFGIEARKVTAVEGLRKALQEAKSQSHPMLIDVEIALGDVCRPRLLFGCKLDEQKPDLKPKS